MNNCKINLYKNNIIYGFNELSDSRISAIEDCIKYRYKLENELTINVDKKQIFGIIINLDLNKIESDKKILIDPENFGSSEWEENIEIIFEKIKKEDELENILINNFNQINITASKKKITKSKSISIENKDKRIIKCSICKKTDHNKRNCPEKKVS